MILYVHRSVQLPVRLCDWLNALVGEGFVKAGAIATCLGRLGLAVLIVSGIANPAAASPQPGGAASQHSAGLPAPTPAPRAKPKKIGIVLFDGFESLDVFGPVEMWARLPDYELIAVSENGGAVRSAQSIETVATVSFANAPQFEILMIPGGPGTRREVNNAAMLNFLRKQDRGTEWTTSVCTGSALLAKAGLLDGRKATSNKVAFDWVIGQSNRVLWQSRARWVVDGKYITSSGVSAGTDMALALVEKLYGRAVADQNARFTEYVWNDDASDDPFAVEAKP